MAYVLTPDPVPEEARAIAATLTPRQRDLLCRLAVGGGIVLVSSLAVRQLAIAQGLAASDVGLLTRCESLSYHGTTVSPAEAYLLTRLGRAVAQALADPGEVAHGDRL